MLVQLSRVPDTLLIALPGLPGFAHAAAEFRSERLFRIDGAKAGELAAKAPHYVRMAKRLIGESIEHSLTDHLQLERHGIADSMGTEDLRRGVTAFKAGETPEFKGD